LEVWDEKRIGVRISPTGTFNDMWDANPSETFSVAVERLNKFRIGYLHVVESAQDGPQNNESEWALLRSLRKLWKGFYIVNGGYDGRRGEEAIRLAMPTPSLTDAHSWPIPICRSAYSLAPR
jgi:N-ethylmaleimide reductase